ncbi:DUF7146 domain-containing protein [Methylobacterium sp. Leaf85]|uniref:DUF7146 domain-containing protein n=1 Tax=Methylobacterium sp. Leaf85 TaxID=1736241 RepID=UPI0006FD56DC|nr:primase-helicase zinc-binding domain-containing protein [Methylobacterium sp. Leaf85]KQO43062.1 hypothetical protein ASF08_10830 [Methylobacterium sp. Leaf85]
MQRQTTVDRMKGRWPEALQKLGIDRKFLVARHGPCPVCSGRDRFRFDDKEGSGSFFCSVCGPGGGIALAMRFTGKPFNVVAEELDKLLPALGPACTSPPIALPAKTDRKRLARLWTKESTAIRPDDAAGLWLAKRAGVTAVPSCLRYHPRLFHGATKTLHPAMLARVQAPDGAGCQIHRTYLTDAGDKAAVTPQRAVMQSPMPRGSAIRLFPVVGTSMGVGEGIETCLCAASLYGLPVWSVLNAGGFKDWRPPDGVEEVVIFADNDANGVGQNGAYALAAALALERYRVRVEIPPTLGTDWRDVWSQSRCTP